jgi:hypothetical protein
MSELRTQESKRRRKAMPEAIERSNSLGCLASIVLYVVVCAVIFAATSWPAAIAFTVIGVFALTAVAIQCLYRLALLVIVERKWSRRGLRCLVVYSNSPTWESHIRQAWLSRLGDTAVVLNWSERQSWSGGLAVRVFREFCSRWHNYNPAVVIFRGLRQPYVFRFFEAFQQIGAGRPEYLSRLEAEMFETLGLATTERLDAARGSITESGELHHAIKRGDVIAVREYLQSGGPVSVDKGHNWTPLTMAAHRGNSEMVRMFLDAGADPNEGWPDSDTPLVLAAMAGSLTAVRLLLARGARTDARGMSVPDLLRHYGYGRQTRILEAVQEARDREQRGTDR